MLTLLHFRPLLKTNAAKETSVTQVAPATKATVAATGATVAATRATAAATGVTVAATRVTVATA